MALTNAFSEAVFSGNTRRVRIMMKDSLLNDPSFSEYEDMVDAARGMHGLYDDHDGRELNYNMATWTDSYMNDLMVQIIGNFSHERIEHLKKVVAYLRPVVSRVRNTNQQQSRGAYSQDYRQTKRGRGEGTTFVPPQGNTDYQAQKDYDRRRGVYLSGRTAAGAAIGAVVGAVVGGVIATVTTTTVAGGAAIGAVVGGATMAVIVNGER